MSHIRLRKGASSDYVFWRQYPTPGSYRIWKESRSVGWRVESPAGETKFLYSLRSVREFISADLAD